MVYCGRCGNTGHNITSCAENYNRDGKRISKISETDEPTRKGQRWIKIEEKNIEDDLEKYITKKALELKRSENAIYCRILKILDEMRLT